VVRYLVSWLGVVAGCYSPRLSEGAPCASDEYCPSPQRCVGGSCATSAAADAPAGDDAAVDAVPVDAVPVDAVPVDAVPVDAVPVDAPLPCTTDGLPSTCTNPMILMCGTACWVRCGNTASQTAATTACTAWSGRLLEIESAAEQSCAQTAYAGVTGWLGLIQMPNQASADAGWTWNGTRPLRVDIFQNWLTGKPDDGTQGENNDEQCARMATNGTWDDVECGQPHRFACER
jgi:hypothetical protein